MTGLQADTLGVLGQVQEGDNPDPGPPIGRPRQGSLPLNPLSKMRS